MINAATLKQDLYGLVGWRQNSDTGGTQIAATEIISSSGLYFNDAHPLLTTDNLLSVAPNHLAGDQAGFSTWLKQKTEAGIIDCVNAWLNKKVLNKTAKSLIESNQLFRTTGRNDLKDEKTTGRLVGFEILPRRSKNIKVVIRKIGLQLDTDQILNVKLFHSGSSSVLSNQDLVYNQSGGIQWFTVDWVLNPNGSYFLVYEQDDLTGQSINGIYDYRWDKKARFYPSGKYTTAKAFHVQSDASVLWSIKDNSYTVATNYGLNLEMDTKCDYTDFIIAQKDLFATTIQLQVGTTLLRELVFNPNSRINRNNSNVNVNRNEVLYELDGDSSSNKKSGLVYRFNQALLNIQFDTTNIDQDCLTCRRRSVKHKTI